MHGHDFYSLYATKAVEYLIAVSYILLFIPFWRFVNGGKKQAAPAHAADATAARAPAVRAPAAEPGWFHVPDGVHLHPGHAWARVVGDEVRIGLDDFAQKLVGPIDALRLPAPGATLRQGEPAFALEVDGKAVDLLAPVDGEVVAVNAAALARPAVVAESPYEAGWLVALRSPRLAACLKQLVSGGAARRWLDEAFDDLPLGHGRTLGLVMQDGGAPVHGFAHALSPEDWDALARKFFRT